MSKKDNTSQGKGFPVWLWLVPAVIPCMLFFTSSKTPTTPEKPVEQVTAPEVKVVPDPLKDSDIRPDKIVEKPPVVLEKSLSAPELIEKRLKEFPVLWQDTFKETMDLSLVESLEKCTSLEEAVIILTSHIDPNFKETDLTDWLKGCVDYLKSMTWGGRKIHELPPKYQLRAIATYLLDKQEFKYSQELTPDLHVISNVINNRKGYCSTLPVLFTLICKRLDMPVYLVSGAQHCFARYDDGQVKINVETTSPMAMGVGTPDEFYMKDEYNGLHIPKILLETTSTMKSMNLRQSISSLLMNNMAALLDRETFSFPFNPLPKNEETLDKVMQYTLTAIYFNRYSVLPISNALNIMVLRPEQFPYQEFANSLHGYAVRKGIRPVTANEIQVLNEQMGDFLQSFSDFHKLYEEFKLTKMTTTQNDGGMVDILRLRIHQASDSSIKIISKYIEANKYIIPKDMMKALTSIRRSYGNMRKQADELL